MAEAVGRFGEFSGWTEDRFQRVMNRLMDSDYPGAMEALRDALKATVPAT